MAFCISCREVCYSYTRFPGPNGGWAKNSKRVVCAKCLAAGKLTEWCPDCSAGYYSTGRTIITYFSESRQRNQVRKIKCPRCKGLGRLDRDSVCGKPCPRHPDKHCGVAFYHGDKQGLPIKDASGPHPHGHYDPSVSPPICRWTD